MSDALVGPGHSCLRRAQDATTLGAGSHDTPSATFGHTCVCFFQERGARQAREGPFVHLRWVPQQNGGNSMLARHNRGTNIDTRLPRGLRVGGPDARAGPFGSPLSCRPGLDRRLETAGGRLALPRRSPCACWDIQAPANRVALPWSTLARCQHPRRQRGAQSTRASLPIGAFAVALDCAPSQPSATLPFRYL